MLELPGKERYTKNQKKAKAMQEMSQKYDKFTGNRIWDQRYPEWIYENTQFLSIERWERSGGLCDWNIKKEYKYTNKIIPKVIFIRNDSNWKKKNSDC